MDLASLAAAVSAYLDEHCDTPVSVVGHSLGGKVAMQMALSSPNKLAALVVADIAPVEYPPSHDAVFAAIEAVTAARPASRSEAAKLMREYLQEEGVVQFLVLSLRRDTAGHYVWRFNSECLKNDYPRFRAAPEGIPYSGPALFVYGSESSYVDAEGIRAAQALFPRAQFTALADTGHWLHAEKPDEFNALINGFLMTFFSRSDNH
jgi:esterase